MKKSWFPSSDIEDRASLVLEKGDFLALKKTRRTTCAMYDVLGDYVEITCVKDLRTKGLQIKSIEYIDCSNTDLLASYVGKKVFREIVKELDLEKPVKK